MFKQVFTKLNAEVVKPKPLLIKLNPEARMPERKHWDDAGLDLFMTEESFTLLAGEQVLLETGVAVSIPVGYMGTLHVRSSQRVAGLTSRGTGIIDAGYRNTIKMLLVNNTNRDIYIDKNKAIAQLVIEKVELPGITLFEGNQEDWENTERGLKGWGSTNE